MDYVSRTWRLELFFKSIEELKVKQLAIAKQHGIKRFNITNKKVNEDIGEYALAVKKEIPDADVCIHYSLKWNHKGGQEGALDRFKQFFHHLKGFDGSILLISGSGKKKSIDTVDALRHLADVGRPNIPINVAFNPYFPKEAEVLRENKRLAQKLKTGLVSGIYLQTGIDVKKLKAALRWIKKLSVADHYHVYGSFFLPSKRLLAQMKFRPWSGVFLSEEYLSSVEAATRLTKEILACYRQNEVIPLLETPLRTEQDIADAHSLMEL